MLVEFLTLPGIPLVKQGDDLADLIIAGLSRAEVYPREGDIFVLAQKIVSKAEGRLVELSAVAPGDKAVQLGRETEKDPRLVELVLSETAGVIKAKPGLLLVEHRLGFVMPNAGIDQSNVGEPGHEKALLLPVDPDASAEALRDRLSKEFGMQIAVVINDSVSRAWRNGTCGVAIGCAGLAVLNDMRGATDLFGRTLKFSITGYADEIAAAASLLMGQSNEGTPVVVVRGLKQTAPADKVSTLLRRPSELAPEVITMLKPKGRAMLDYVYGQDKLVADFTALLIPAVRERGFPASKAIGIVELPKGELIAGMVYHNFDPASGVIEMSGAAVPGKYWLTPETLRRIYDYPFLEIGCQMVIMRVPEENRMLLRVLASIGYTFILVPRLLGHNKNCVLCTLTFEDWSSNKFNVRDHRRFATRQKEKAA